MSWNIKSNKKSLIVATVAFLMVGGALFTFSRKEEKRSVFQVPVSSYHEGATISLAKVRRKWIGKDLRIDGNKSWREVTPGVVPLEEGGHFYRLDLANGRTKMGLIEVVDNSPIVLK